MALVGYFIVFSFVTKPGQTLEFLLWGTIVPLNFLVGYYCSIVASTPQPMAYASTMPLYCTCSVSQRCKKTRAILPFGGRFVAEIFVQNFKWRVSERGADVNYILIQLLLLYLKRLLSYTAWHNCFQAFFCRSNPSHPHIYNACVYNAFVKYLLSVTALQKDEGYTSLRRPFCSRNIRPKFQMTGVSERGRRKLYFDPTFVIVSQELAELYSLT